MNSKKEQPKQRRTQIEYLEACITNPGRFSVLVLGDRGTGKKYWIKEKYKNEKECPIIEIAAGMTEPSTIFWTEQFEKANQGILIVENVEELSKENQRILFQGLSTTNGSFGFEEPKEYEVRIVFTSTKNISILRDTEKYLSHRFFDRIAQLVVRFPGFTEVSSTITKDLENTWEKFEFETVYPTLLSEWLKEVAHRLHGNFRDLDKLCINWNNYQLMGLSEEKILARVKTDFNDYYRYPETNKEAFFEIQFSADHTYQDTLNQFKMQYRKWAKDKYHTLRKAGEALNINHRTMERW